MIRIPVYLRDMYDAKHLVQAAQFLLKHFFHAIDRLDQIMRKLCGKVDFLPAMIPV